MKNGGEKVFRQLDDGSCIRFVYFFCEKEGWGACMYQTL